MELERINTFDGIKVIPKDTKDNFLFLHCSGGEDVKEADEDNIMNMILAHGVEEVSIEDHSSVTELRNKS